MVNFVPLYFEMMFDSGLIELQLIDDLLDFTSHENIMGKPTAADLRLGLATAPVLYAAQVSNCTKRSNKE